MSDNVIILDHLIKHSLPHYHKKFPLILFWSPKSGCTTFLKWFFFQIGILEKAIEYHPWVHNYEWEVYKRRDGYRKELKEDLLQSKKTVFKLVRNPYKRAVSSFLHFLYVIYYNNQNPNLLEKINELLYNDKNCNKGVSFKQFLYFIKHIGSDTNSIDSHYSMQYMKGEEIFIKNYIHLENFNDHISRIEEKYQLKKCPLSAIKGSHHYYAPSMNMIGNYSETIITEDYFLKKSLPTYKSFYDKETVALVKEIFKKDIELYGYDPL